MTCNSRRLRLQQTEVYSFGGGDFQDPDSVNLVHTTSRRRQVMSYPIDGKIAYNANS